MQFLKNFFKHDSIIGLTGLKKKTEYVYIEVPKEWENSKNISIIFTVRNRIYEYFLK